MRFLSGLVLGFALGFVAYMLLEPVRREEVRRRLRAILEERELESLSASLREQAEGLAKAVREAWEEAKEAGRRAEEEAVARYRRLRRPLQGRP